MQPPGQAKGRRLCTIVVYTAWRYCVGEWRAFLRGHIAPRLFRSLELLGDPLRSQVAVNLLGLQPLRALGAAELAWRNPSLGLQQQLVQIDEQLAQIKLMKPAKRKAALRRLLFEWHPDKNRHRHGLATEAFQHLQVQKAEIFGKNAEEK